MFRGQKTPFTSAEAKQMCAQLANDYIAALDQYLATSSLKSAQDVYDFVTARIEEVEDSMSETEQSLQELQSEYLLMDPESKTRMVITGAQDAGVEYARTRREAASQASSLNASRALLKKEDAERIAGQVTQRNPMIVNLEQRLASLQGELASEMADGKKSEHPSVVSLEAAIADTREQLDQVAQDVLQQVTQQPNPVYDSLLQDVARLEVQLAGTLARQAQIGQQVQQAEEELRELPTIVREYAYLNRRQAIQGETLTALAREREAAAINLRRESTGSFDVLDAAVPPEKKAGPSSVKAAAVAFVMVMGLLAIGWAYRRGLFTDYDGPLCAGVVGAHGSELPAGEGIDPDSAGGVDGGGKPAP